MPTAAVAASCSSPSAPMPMIFPVSSTRAEVLDSSTSMTRLAFSSTTPVATHMQYAIIWLNSMISATSATVLRCPASGSFGASLTVVCPCSWSRFVT